MATVKLEIAELRKEKGIGQQDLAEALGVSFQSVSKWETGITMPDITLLHDTQEAVKELKNAMPVYEIGYPFIGIE